MTHPAYTLSPGRERLLLWTLAGIQFSHILDFMIMMPLGPQFTQLFGISDAQFGFLVSAYTLAAGASGLLAATYVDRFGRKRLLLVLYALFGLATLACGLAPTYGALMAARIASGLFGGILSALSQTIVADVIPFERRGRAMGIVMTAFSVSTVAGVPMGLFLAGHFSWHAPFFAIAALSLILGVFVAWTLPALDRHVQHGLAHSPLRAIGRVLDDRNHQKAFLFSALLVFAGFTVIPYITLYSQSTAGLRPEHIPYIYLCGGSATLLTSRWFGRMSDQHGKVRVFRIMALAVIFPLLATTLVRGVPVWTVMLVSTLFFVCMNGRMVPGMAIVTSAANPALRGTFMTLNSAVQSAAMGSAAFVGGLLISRDAQGMVQNYWMSGLLGACASLAALTLVGRLHLHGAPGGATRAPD